ncbi:MAG: adenosylcobinamide-GDP ribazoletransferase [Eubacterium sp.]|nr:adenosylcobinamide-GDP ribazoletransferase [Eubacterium sp.]
MRKFLIAISFFTRIPITLKDVSEEEFYESMILMPVVGLLVGAVLLGAAWLFSYIHVLQLQALLLLIVYIWFTGGLHLDGFADTTDALFSARDHAKMMEIMKDSRLGSFGAIGLILLFLTLWSCYTVVLPDYPLAVLLLPMVGRYCAIQACCFSTYAEGGGGLGKRIVEMTRPVHVFIYILLIGLFAWFVVGRLAFFAFLITAVLGLLLTLYLKKKIGGMTGDTIGMTIELTQALYLVSLAVILANWPGLV